VKPGKFKYVRAEAVDQAVELLAGSGSEVRILAGGQSLIPALSARTISASLLLDVMRCPGLDEFLPSVGEITIGAACRQSKIEHSRVIQESIPLLADALGWVAVPQVRSRGTVVGCLAQANPGGEIPVAALALDAELNIRLHGSPMQRKAAREVYAVGAGARLPEGSMIVSASFRRLNSGEGWGFREVQLRQGHFALVCCAATLRLHQDRRIQSARIAVGGLNPNPYRAVRAEKALIGEVADGDSLFRAVGQIASEDRPWPARSDLHGTGSFRAKVAVATVMRALIDARGRCSTPNGRAK
jgi:CO/xanthine dehydrogenase FAD-binding subunit